YLKNTLESNRMNLNILKEPASIILAPAGDQTTSVGKTVVLAAYAKDADGNTLSGFTYQWSLEGAGSLSAGNTSVVTYTADRAGIARVNVSLESHPELGTLSRNITIYDSVSTNNLACSTASSVRLDFVDRGNGLEGIEHNGLSLKTYKTYQGGKIKVQSLEGTGEVRSADLYTGSTPIKSVVLTKNDQLTGDQVAKYYVSFDGSNWQEVRAGVAVNGAGTDIRWKAVLSGTNTPILHWVNLKMSYANNVEADQKADNSYSYVKANCKDNIYQIATLKTLDSGKKELIVQGNYPIKGSASDYQDPGPMGIYSGETDELLIRKFIGK
nr:hypothetical protein [Candidatus Gracilibacteria bacterium]